MLGYLSLDIICSSKLTVFLELRSRKTVRFLEQIMYADKYPSIFSRQMKAIVYLKLHCFAMLSLSWQIKDKRKYMIELEPLNAVPLKEDRIAFFTICYVCQSSQVNS